MSQGKSYDVKGAVPRNAYVDCESPVSHASYTEQKQEPQGALIAHLSTMSTSVKS